MIIQHGDDAYEILRTSSPEGASVELNDTGSRREKRPQPLLEAAWNDNGSRLSFVAYAEGVEIPFEVVEAFMREARSWLPRSPIMASE